MKISSYEIELPINKLSPYQQLYRGRHKNGQVYLLHIFPKQYLTKEMVDQIYFREKQFDFVSENIESKEFILISYQESAFWINLEQQIKIDQLKFYYLQLYQQYSILEGNIDFDPDYIFLYEGQIYILDYGIREFVIKKHRDIAYTTKTKTYLFGLLLLNLNCKKNVSEKIQSCKDQYQIEYIIKQEAETNSINYDILECILKMVILDTTKRPTFQEVGQWQMFFSKKQVKRQSLSVIDFTNIKIPSQNQTIYNSSQTIIQNNQQLHNFQTSNHNQSVRAAILKQQRQVPISKSIRSSYDFASTIVAKNLQNKKQSSNNIQKGIFTQESFYQNGTVQNNSKQVTISNKLNSNYFFYQNPSSSQQKIQQKVENIEFKNSQIEKNPQTIQDAIMIPDIIVTKPIDNQILNEQKIIKNSIKNSPLKNPQIQQQHNNSYLNVPNLSFNKFYNTNSQNGQTYIDKANTTSQSQQNIKTEKQLDNQNLNLEIKEELSNQQINQQKEVKQTKLKISAAVKFNNNDEDKIDDLFFSQQVDPELNLVQNKQCNKQFQGKKQEIFKKPLQENQLKYQNTYSDKNDFQGNIDSFYEIEQNQEIQNKQDPKVDNSQDQFAKNLLKPDDLSEKFDDFKRKYFHYLQIIDYIIITVNDLNEKLSYQGKQWIVPLTVVYKRAFVIRKLFLQNIQKEKNIFNLSDFSIFKTSTNYQTMITTIIQQNQKIENEFQLMLEKANSVINTMDNVSKQKLESQLNLDVKNSTKVQPQKYLYTQLYPKVKSSLAKVTAGNLQNNQFSESEWIQSKLLCLYSVIIMDLDMYQVESQDFKEQTFILFRNNKNNDQVEMHCNELEIKVNQLPQFNNK
ncbi:unnamed protein product [Paramecium sonneborni]|uniref:Uncharacterized protein n=1 Tax=Paramecium sonneborni TaxID=65129 RepID=A0A8S1KWN8_9CILI|nr:unnamed protein product [Paramecium sonneborni]